MNGKSYDDLNVTPMLDLAFVLLLIFIIMTTAAVQGIKVNLPQASDTPSLAKPKTVAITVKDNGTLYMDGDHGQGQRHPLHGRGAGDHARAGGATGSAGGCRSGGSGGGAR